MTPQLQAELKELSLSEKIQLVQELWDDIAASAESIPLTSEQTAKLDERLTEYQVDPNIGSPWNEVKKRILS